MRYLAATHGVEVGGDFYDVVRLPNAQVALAVGDVVGHDITAAATMGQLTSVYRALLVDRPTPSAMIDRLQASWSLLGLQRMATALFAALDPATGQLAIASAGHLPPLVITEGRAEFLPVQPSRMLGAPPAPAPALEWAGVLPVGATLVLFTDGLVESRSADLDEGLAHLLDAAARWGTSDPDELCDRLLADLTGAHRADDIALLALTRLPGLLTGGALSTRAELDGDRRRPIAEGAFAPDRVGGPRRSPGECAIPEELAPGEPGAQAIDGATGDWSMSGDAMRWSPELAERGPAAGDCAGWTPRSGSARGLGLDMDSVRRLVSAR